MELSGQWPPAAGGEEPLVRTDVPYTYEQFVRDYRAVRRRYPFIQLRTIGYSVFGRPLLAFGLGEGRKNVLYNGAHHANEWITTPVLMQFMADYARAVARGEPLAGRDIGPIYRNSTIWLVPMVNPDGVNLVIRGVAAAGTLADEVVVWNEGSTNFRRWKANIRGVDLNRQYPADWEVVEALAPKSRSYRDYPRPAPLSEPEAEAMARFTQRLNPSLVMAYHSQGQVIFWNYRGLAPREAALIAQELGRITGYQPIAEAGTGGGYKDWFILRWGKPGFTMEVGRGVNPLPLNQFPRIYAANLPAMLYAATV